MARRSKPAAKINTRRPDVAGPQETAQQTPISDESLVGPTDVALMLGVPVSWVYTKSEAGELPSYKLGHYRKFKWSEISEYLRACRSNGK